MTCSNMATELSPGLKQAALPEDPIEVGRILDAWGVKGWVKVLTHSAEPEALFAAKDWFLQAPEARFRPGFSAFSGTVSISLQECKVHSDTVVAKIAGLEDRSADLASLSQTPTARPSPHASGHRHRCAPRRRRRCDSG
jgi:16S rRNA processing protein RimM